MLLIADPERAVGLAGVMGGRNSEMHEDTTDVLLESATFNALNTRRTANALHLRTEASLRFEKGLNPELAIRAVRRATQLILETAGGTAAAGVSNTFPERTESNKMLFTNGNMRRVLGADFPHAQVIEVLRALGFTVDALDEDKLLVRPPYWRSDIAIEEDIIEEVRGRSATTPSLSAPLPVKCPRHSPSRGRSYGKRCATSSSRAASRKQSRTASSASMRCGKRGPSATAGPSRSGRRTP